MRLGWVDRAAYGKGRVRLMILPRKQGEGRTDYAARFFREVTGLGNVHLVLVCPRTHRIVASRGL